MKKGTLTISILFLILLLPGQEIQEKAIAINIEVPVRVFTRGKFVEELSIDDFEVYEDGVLQKLEALYLVKKTVIDKEETELDKKSARRIYLPEVSRTFVLVFEMMDYFPKIRDTLQYFFEHVFLPDDSLYIVTPLKSYSFKKEFLDKTPKGVIVNQLKEKLVKDIKLAAREWKSMIKGLEWLASTIRDEGMPSDVIIKAGENILRQIRDFRHFDEKKLMVFRDQIKDIEGQKYVFLFFQKKVVPIPPEFGEIDDLDSLVRPTISFSVDKVKEAFSDITPLRIMWQTGNSEILRLR